MKIIGMPIAMRQKPLCPPRLGSGCGKVRFGVLTAIRIGAVAGEDIEATAKPI